jgi:Uncharacterized protein conserved in bacteria
MTWNDAIDLDIYCLLPNGKKCWYGDKTTEPWITLDIDKVVAHHGRTDLVENITMQTNPCMDGVYKFYISYYEGDGRPCYFQWLFNYKDKNLYQGLACVLKAPEDTHIVEITMDKGHVVKKKFFLEREKIR